MNVSTKSTAVFIFWLLSVAAASLSVTPVVSAASLYSVTALPAGFTAQGINDFGEIVGFIPRGDFGGDAQVYQNGTLTALPTSLGVFSDATAINNSGEIVGDVSETDFIYPVIFRNGDVVTITSIDHHGYASAINQAGTVVGYQDGQAAIWTTGGTTLLLGPFSQDPTAEAVAINNTGLVVGDGLSGSGFAFYYDLNGNGSAIYLGSLGGGFTRAVGVNDNGEIVGNSTLANSDAHAFLYTGGALHDLGTLGGATSKATGINASGEIVGSADTSAGGPHAFVDQNGTLLDLNTLIPSGSGVDLTSATEINNRGQIISLGADGNDYLLTPLANVPEPATTGLLAIGMVSLALKWRKGRFTVR